MSQLGKIVEVNGRVAAEWEMFPASNGRATGIGGLVLAGIVAIYAVAGVDQSVGFPLLALAFLMAVLTYAAVLRPRIGLSDDELVLRQMFSTTWIPLAAIQDITVRQMTIIRVADRKYDTPALARPRTSLRQRLRWAAPDHTAMDHLKERLDKAATSARKRAKVGEWSEEQAALADGIRSQWSWPLIGLASVGVLAVVVAFLA